MTVASEANIALRAWTGVETSFAAGFTAEGPNNVGVKAVDPATLLETFLSNGTHYSLAIAGDGSVTITPITFPIPPKIIVIWRDTGATQEVDFEDLQDFSADTHEMLHDRWARLHAEHKGGLARSLRAPRGEFLAEVPAAGFRANAGAGSVLGFDGASGQPVLLNPASAGGGVIAQKHRGLVIDPFLTYSPFGTSFATSPGVPTPFPVSQPAIVPRGVWGPGTGTLTSGASSIEGFALADGFDYSSFPSAVDWGLDPALSHHEGMQYYNGSGADTTPCMGTTEVLH